MATIVRTADEPYRWQLGEAPLDEVANVERTMPPSYIDADGFGITAAARRYLEPLIAGEDPPTYSGGLPDYTVLGNAPVDRKLAPFTP